MQQTELINNLKTLFENADRYHLEVQPHTHLRVTRGDRWIIASTDEYLKDYDFRKGTRAYNRRQQIVRSNAHAEELKHICRRDKFNLLAGSYMMVFMKHMPKTWRKGKRKPCKRDLMAWTPMKARPDVDNFYKKISDSLLNEDKSLWCVGIIKIWIPDEIEEGTYFMDVPVIFETVVNYLKEKLQN